MIQNIFKIHSFFAFDKKKLENKALVLFFLNIFNFRLNRQFLSLQTVASHLSPHCLSRYPCKGIQFRKDLAVHNCVHMKVIIYNIFHN